jgi:hypothetical protein
MFHKPKTPAPEPYASAVLWVIYRVALFIRDEAHSISPEQLSDLGDALHNVPESLCEYGHYFDERVIRDDYFKAYDEKWVRSSNDFSLVGALDAGIFSFQQWQHGNDARKL